MSRAFTLIELLIVVAIIAILAAIAVPNFLEAQTRSKVSRVKSDFRALATAIESYGVDRNRYPISYAVGLVTNTYQFDISLSEITTPIAYMSTVKMRDPFNENTNISNGQLVRPLLMYFNYEVLKPSPPFQDISNNNRETWRDWASTRSAAPDYPLSHRAFSLWSPGPDRNDNNLYHMENDAVGNPNGYFNTAIGFIYDPTNGTVSKGDIMRLSSGARAAKLPLN